MFNNESVASGVATVLNHRPEGNIRPLPQRATDYFMLVDQAGRLGVHSKLSRIDPSLDPILERLGLSADPWASASTAFRRYYRQGELRLTQAA